MSGTYRKPPQRAAFARTIGAELEHQRLTHRARRLELALTALHDQRDQCEMRGPVPAAMDRAIADFSQQLRDLRARSRAIAREPPR